MRVSTRLAVGSGLFLLLLAAILTYHLILVGRLARLARGLAHTNLTAASLSLQQANDLDEVERTLRKYQLTRDPDYARHAAQLAQQIAGRQARLAALPLSGAEREAVDRASALWAASLLARAGAEGPTALQGDGGEDSPALKEAAALQAAAREEAAAVERSVAAKARAAGESALAAQKVSAAATLAGLAVGAVLVWLTTRAIRVPLRHLTGATHSVARGRFDARLLPEGGDEFRELARDFNSMVSKLSELDQMKRDLLSNVSHELKGPLASMQEATGLLLEEIPGPLSDSQRRLLELTRKSAARLSGMISKLLDMARIDAGVLEYDLKAQQVAPLIQTALAELQVRADERGVRLVFHPGQGPYVAHLDADRFAQVAGNLLENAIKFSPPGGLVEAALEPAAPGLAHPGSGRDGSPGGGRILLTIADRGPGVPEGQREKIFERFHQVPRPARRGEGGVGLGLAICKEIVTAHGGDLWMEERPGGGSLFRILLPLAPAPPSGERME
jgi:signal transduction histidine kinase